MVYRYSTLNISEYFFTHTLSAGLSDCHILRTIHTRSDSLGFTLFVDDLVLVRYELRIFHSSRVASQNNQKKKNNVL